MSPSVLLFSRSVVEYVVVRNTKNNHKKMQRARLFIKVTFVTAASVPALRYSVTHHNLCMKQEEMSLTWFCGLFPLF